jgi:hypothetical protein
LRWRLSPTTCGQVAGNELRFGHSFKRSLARPMLAVSSCLEMYLNQAQQGATAAYSSLGRASG